HVDEPVAAVQGPLAVVDQNNLAAAGIAPDPPDQVAVAIGDADDLHAVRPDDDRDGFTVAMLDADVAGADGETVRLVVADDAAAAFVHDDAVAFVDDDAIAFAPLVPFAAHVGEPPLRRVAVATDELAGTARARRRRRG